MRMTPITGALVVAWSFASQPAVAQSKKIDLRTTPGVTAVKGQWKYHDVKIVEVTGEGPDGKPNKTYDIEPRAEKVDFDDSQWQGNAPETLRDRRSTGKVCFCWYSHQNHGSRRSRGQSRVLPDDGGRLRGEIRRRRPPASNAGKRRRGRCGGIQRSEPRRALGDPLPGKVYQIAVFGINGPISATCAQLDLSWRHLPGDHGQEVSDGVASLRGRRHHLQPTAGATAP